MSLGALRSPCDVALFSEGEFVSRRHLLSMWLLAGVTRIGMDAGAA
jgi:hypothetical protein